jgi:hypothetical protein
METSTQNRKFTKRKFWFPVGVFSLVLLPILLYQNLLTKIENKKIYCQEIELFDAQHEFGRNIIKAAEIGLNDNLKRINKNQIQYLRDELKLRRKGNPDDDFSNVYLEIKQPKSFSYQDFVSLTDSLNKF